GGRRTALRRRSRAWWVIAGAALVAAALRLPYLWTGLSPDEGGYAYLARQWAAGARLYGPEAGIDRPPGPLLNYPAPVALDGSGTSIRVLAVPIGAAMTVLVALIGGQLAGPRLAAAAAVLYAVVGVAPHIEGFTLNGELLASVPATASVVAALWSRRPG